jgi:two-component system capsular synthesis response regulator RcsB
VALKIVTANNSPIALAGMNRLCEESVAVTPIAQAADSTELIEIIRRQPCNILMTDYQLDGEVFGDGIALLSVVKRLAPSLQVIVLTSITYKPILDRIDQMGMAVLNSYTELDTLIEDFRCAALSPAVRNGSGRLEASSSRCLPPSVRLTAREAEVVRLYVGGLGVTQIARKLHRSTQTICSHKFSAMKKLQFKTDAALFKFAADHGLISKRRIPLTIK